jgi:hypothetical protein
METKTQKKCKCQDCERRKKEELENDEMNFAILIALVPAMTMTLFSSMGFF